MSNYPFHVALLIKASILNNAKAFLLRNGLGYSLTKVLILKADPDNATAKGYAALLHCTAGERTMLAKKADAAGNNAFVFWSTNKKQAKQKALDFIDSKGYRIKP